MDTVIIGCERSYNFIIILCVGVALDTQQVSRQHEDGDGIVRGILKRSVPRQRTQMLTRRLFKIID